MIDLETLRSIASETINNLPCEKEMVTDQQLLLFLNLYDEDSKIFFN